MDKRKKDGKHPRDFWDDFFNEPFNEIFNMRRNMDRMFRDAIRTFSEKAPRKKPFVYGFSIRIGPDGIPHFQQFGDTGRHKYRDTTGMGDVGREPLTDIIETEDKVTITMELPGVEKDDINLEVVEDNIIIDVGTENRKYHKESKLPENLDLDNIKANYKNGILEIIINRKIEKAKKGKKIKID